MTVLPGPSAVETALVASGLVAEQYRFLGFLPRGESKLASLWEELRGWPWPAVAFESPQRLPGTLRSLAAFDSQREVAVCRELTKRFEEVVARDGRRGRGALRTLRRRARSRSCSGRPLAWTDGEGEQRALAAVGELVAAGVPRRRAAEIVSGLVGISRNRLYKRSL